VFVRIPETVHISSISVQQNTPGVGSGQVKYTLRKNGADTALSVLLSPTDAGVIAFDTDIQFEAGDRVSVSVEKTGVAGTAPSAVVITLGNG
jgi:hypothetical protein